MVELLDKQDKRRVYRRIRRSLVAFFLMLGIGWGLGYIYGRPLVESKLRNAFTRATKNRYEIEFERLDLSYQSAGIRIKNLHIYPKKDSLQALENTTLLELNCTNVSIHQINFLKTFTGKDFSAEELSFDNPVLQVWNNDSIKPKPESQKKKGRIGDLRIDKIRITNAKATVKNKRNKRLLYETQHLDLIVDGFGISENMVPVYSHFSLQSTENSIGIFPNQSLRVGKLFMAGDAKYTALNANGFDISEIDSSMRTRLKIPDEITFSLDGISLESSSLSQLTEQFVEGKTEQIKISNLLLIHPQVWVETKRSANKDSAETSEKFKRVSKKLILPGVDKLGILNGEFTWLESGEKKPVLHIDDIYLSASELRPRRGEKFPVIYSTAEVHAGKTVFTYPKSDYSFYAEHVHYQSFTDSLKIEHFKVMPHKNIDSFYMDKKWRVDRFEFECDSVYIQKLRVSDMVFKNEFNPQKIIFKSPQIKAYTDKRLNHDPNYIKPFPLKKLKEIDGKYNIGQLIFENGTATYTEKVADSPGLGNLKITKANLELRHIKSAENITDSAHVDFNCSLGAGSYAEMHIDIPLFGEDEIQFARGMIKHLPLKQLNSITENTVFMGFADGELDSCWFTFKAVNGKAEGNSVFLYNNLKVKLYKVLYVPSYQANVLMNKTWITLAANLLINKNNPTEEGYSMPGTLAFERDKLKGPLNFWIKTIMTGLMNTVIDDISELKDLQEEIKSLKSNSKTGILSKMKSNPIKKTIRKQARDARRATKNADETK